MHPGLFGLRAGRRLARRPLCALVPGPSPQAPTCNVGRAPSAQRRPLHDTSGQPGGAVTGRKSRARFADFDLTGRALVVTGGARGLGLALAEALAEAGGKGKARRGHDEGVLQADARVPVYCLDRLERPDDAWHEARARMSTEGGGSLEYQQLDVCDTSGLDRTMQVVADDNGGLHGLIAAAGIQQVTPAVDYTAADAKRMMDVNYTGVLMSAAAAARAMFRHGSRGSICLVASMSGLVANKGLVCPVYNSSKAALIQLARSLAMEWSPRGIRVNCLSPGHTLTPMVLKNLEDAPGLAERWCAENMLGRLAEASEYKGAAVFLLSDASSFMTGANLVIDGGHTSW